MAWSGATCAIPDRRDVVAPERNGRDEVHDSQGGFKGDTCVGRAGNVYCRARRLDHRLRDSPAMRGTIPDLTHRRRGAMAAAPSDGSAAADAMVTPRRSSNPQGSHLHRQRHIRSRSCRRRAMRTPSVSESSVTTPRFWTVSGDSTDAEMVPGAAVRVWSVKANLHVQSAWLGSNFLGGNELWKHQPH